MATIRFMVVVEKWLILRCIAAKVMTVEQQKLSLIEQIASLKDATLVYRLAQFLSEHTEVPSNLVGRQAGFAKGIFPYVADDFDDTLPPGFDDYLQKSGIDH